MLKVFRVIIVSEVLNYTIFCWFLNIIDLNFKVVVVCNAKTCCYVELL